MSSSIAFRAATTGRTNITSSLTLAKPAGVVQNDVMIAVINSIGWPYPVQSVPAGWTLVDGVVTNSSSWRGVVYYKVAGASEPTSYVWTIGPNAYFGAGSLVAYSGADPTNPIAQHAVVARASGVTSSATPSITTSVDGAMLVSWWANLAPTSMTVTTPPSDTLRAAPVDSTVDRGAVSDQLQSVAGTASKTASFSTATNNGSGAGILALVPPIPGPTATVAPSITGSANEAETLDGTDGTWSGAPTSYARQWQRCDVAGTNCAAITGATASSYVLTAADGGSTIRFAVTATNAGGSTTAQSPPTAIVKRPPLNSGAPAITGTPTQGWTLTVTDGSWTNNPTSLTRKWRRCDSAGGACVDIAAATDPTYMSTEGDVASTIRAVVTASNAEGSTSVASAPTPVIAPVDTVTPPSVILETQPAQSYNGAYVQAVKWTPTDDDGYELAFQRRTYDDWVAPVVYACLPYVTWPKNTCGHDGIGYDGRTYGTESFREELWREFGTESKNDGDLVPIDGDCGDLTGLDAPDHNPCFAWRWYDGQDPGPVAADQPPAAGESDGATPVAPSATSPVGPVNPNDYTAETWAPEETETDEQLAVITSTQPGTTAVTGIVTDEATAAPVAGANVTMAYVDASGATQSVSTTSDSSGGYAFVNMPPETYTVTFTASGHGALTFTDDTYEADQTYELTAPLAAADETYDGAIDSDTDNADSDYPPPTQGQFSTVLPPPSIRVALLPLNNPNSALVKEQKKYACGAADEYSSATTEVRRYSMFRYLARVAYREIAVVHYNELANDAFSSMTGNFAWYHATLPGPFDVMNAGGLPNPSVNTGGNRYSFQCFGDRKGKVITGLQDNIITAMKWHFSGHGSPIYETSFNSGISTNCTDNWWINNQTPPGEGSQLGLGTLSRNLGCLPDPPAGDSRSTWQRLVSVYYPPCSGPLGCFRKNAKPPTPKILPATTGTDPDGTATKTLHFVSQWSKGGVTRAVAWHYIVWKYYFTNNPEQKSVGWHIFKFLPYNKNQFTIRSCGAYQVQATNPVGSSAQARFVGKRVDPKTKICP
jgi:hypothetical protein